MKISFVNNERCVVAGRNEPGVVTKVRVVRTEAGREFVYEVQVDNPAWKGDKKIRHCSRKFMMEEKK